MGPSVAILIPAYNATPFIGETIASVAAQELMPDQIVLVDDGSTDGTAAVAAEAASAHGLEMEIVTRPNGGAAAARNVGIERLRTDLVAFLDADDVLLPHHLALLVGAFQRHPELVLCFGDAAEFDEQGPLRPSLIAGALALPFDLDDDGLRLIRGSAFASLLGGNYIPTSGHVVSVRALRDEKGFDETLTTSEDRELLLRLACRGRFAYYPRVVNRKRMHGTSLTSTESSLNIVRNGLHALTAFSSKGCAKALNNSDAAALRAAIHSAACALVYAGSCQGIGTFLAERKLVRKMTGRPAPWIMRDIVRAVWRSRPAFG
jgi:glycosyltransferase involved in cell wall biosynthesis